ncbi:immunoglobulin-like domain-containing protein [Erysipelothrix aquatica]|uniref:immunoglobulin-like domain-containing protein n=1 Tax=Erysipelothrix aquatica TaxID=2683714 RepID=UPI001359ED27|nr:immunoglobulin-like domain-containing protein [Erysipelothrix aquatica]
MRAHIFMELKKIGYPLLLMLVILSGCSTRDRKGDNVIFIDDETIEFSEDFLPCSLVKEVENVAITPSMISTEKPIIDMGTKKNVTCNTKHVTKKLGTIDYTYTYDRNEYVKSIVFVDTTPPTITANDTYKVKVGNEYFDLRKVIEVTDNDTETPKVAYSGTVDVNTVGTYVVVVKAIDRSNNTTSKTITVEVVAEDIPDIYKEPETPNTSSSDSSNNVTPSVPIPPTGGASTTNPPASTFKPSQRDFMFKQGEDASVQFNACMGYLNEQAQAGYHGVGNCILITDSNTKLNTGYRAVFD